MNFVQRQAVKLLQPVMIAFVYLAYDEMKCVIEEQGGVVPYDVETFSNVLLERLKEKEIVPA